MHRKFGFWAKMKKYLVGEKLNTNNVLITVEQKKCLSAGLR